LKINPAFDNPEKCKSREHIVKTINGHVDGPIRMIEFLGNGSGLKYYLGNIKNLQTIVGLEKDGKIFDEWKEENFPLIFLENPNKIFTFHMSLEKFISYPFENKIFNVLNLDFCTFFYDNDSPISPLRTVEKVFSSNILSNKSLVIFTFMVDGWQVQLKKNSMEILQTSETIGTVLKNLVESLGKYKLGYDVLTYEYTSCGRGKKTKMLNLGFMVDKVVEDEW